MFERILIANRGEIACRIVRTARRMGVSTVAVFSDADAGALHVEMADEAVHIGAPPPAESYLCAARIIEAALETGAQAIHPGYGFLSENPDFVEKAEQAGLTFIGPSADAIRAMGLKDAAKRVMEQAGVPVVPGWHGDNQDPEHLAAAAAAIGWPVLIKAVAGGGGKGMRLVDGPDAFAGALEGARREARGAFGNDAVLVEKYIEKPRHIEVQIFGDGTRAVHLFERDCSLQRRHQKVIEEAPAPGMTDEMRTAMGQAAVRAAEAIGYRGAGTVEFIVDASEGLRPDRFWFMEMNTRLQVEHPVTEAVTGIDLVEWQLRVAAGEPLPATQDDISLSGHAFEARLYAEDVSAGFLPATGRLDHLVFPQEARIDTGVRAGDEISPWYDPMIAKITTCGPTRDIALSRLRRALAHTEVAGTTTNLDFLATLTRQPDFGCGDVDTGLIARRIDTLARLPAPPPFVPFLAALGAAGLAGASAAGQGAAWSEGFALWQPLEREVRLEGGGEEITARITVIAPGRYRVKIGTAESGISTVPGGYAIDGCRVAARVVRHGGRASVFAGHGWHFDLPDPLARAQEAGEGSENGIRAPMPGLVQAVFAAPGQAVSAGDRLAVLEAMKMAHELVAPRDCMVTGVFVRPGQQVEAGALLIGFGTDDDETGSGAAE